VVHVEEHASRAAVLVAVALDRLAHRGRVDDRQHLLDVFGQQPVEQHLVAIAQVGQEDVLRQVLGLALVLRVDPPKLSLYCGLPARQQPVEPEGTPFLLGERGAPVEHRVGQHVTATGPDVYRVTLLWGREIVRSFVHGAYFPFLDQI
jgi:hypothetical protein